MVALVLLICVRIVIGVFVDVEVATGHWLYLLRHFLVGFLVDVAVAAAVGSALVSMNSIHYSGHHYHRL